MVGIDLEALATWLGLANIFEQKPTPPKVSLMTAHAANHWVLSNAPELANALPFPDAQRLNLVLGDGWTASGWRWVAPMRWQRWRLQFVLSHSSGVNIRWVNGEVKPLSTYSAQKQPQFWG